MAERQRISSGSPYEPVIGFSRAVRVGDRVLVSGTGPIWPDGSVDPDAQTQAARCLEIILAALAVAGATADEVVRTRMYLVSADDWEAVGRAHGAVFGDVRPAATMVVVAALLDARWRVEIEAEAIDPRLPSRTYQCPAMTPDTRAASIGIVPRRIFVFDDPDRFAAGAIGSPGQRVFFLQAVEGRRITSVSLEKVQVALLADRVAAIVAELQARGAPGAPDLTSVEVPGDDERPLDEPLSDAFRAGTLTISWDGDESGVTIEARSQEGDTDADDDTDDDDDDTDEVADDAPEGPDVLRVRLSAAMALGFARRAARVVAAGRPPCPFCGQPLNPEGHVCVRSNGYLN